MHKISIFRDREISVLHPTPARVKTVHDFIARAEQKGLRNVPQGHYDRGLRNVPQGHYDRGPRLLEARGGGLSVVESVLDDCLEEHQTVIDPIAGGERMTD